MCHSESFSSLKHSFFFIKKDEKPVDGVSQPEALALRSKEQFGVLEMDSSRNAADGDRRSLDASPHRDALRLGGEGPRGRISLSLSFSRGT